MVFVGAALAFGSFSCSGGVDTKPAPADDDDDDGTTATPTPTGTATPAEYPCAFGALLVQFGTNGVAVIGVGNTAGTLTFDIGLSSNPAIGIGEAPSGMVDGNGDFTQNFSYCTYDGASTTKYYGTWTGTFAPDGLSFDSTLVEALYVRTGGDYRATCAVDVTTSDAPFCASPGATFEVHAVKQ